jgi:mannosylglycoprotein endo-beta-mannosidase
VIAQDVFHSVKKKNLKETILKLDLSKAYDRVNWTFLRFFLIQLGMSLRTLNWIMGCLQSESFAVLINESPSIFFKTSRGLRQGFPLSPFIFLLIVEALSKMIKEP